MLYNMVPDQQANLYQKNRAGDLIPEEPGKNVAIKHWILISRWLDTRITEAAWCYIILDPDQQATLYQKNRTSMLLYKTGSWSEGDFIPEEPDQHAVI